MQAELQLKAGGSTFTSPILPGLAGQGPQATRAQLQRAAVQRHHARRSASLVTSGNTAQQTLPFAMQTAMMSPQIAPTPSSHISSSSDPSSGSPGILQAGSAMTSPVSNPVHFLPQQQPQQRQDFHQKSPVSVSNQHAARPLSHSGIDHSSQAGTQRPLSNRAHEQSRHSLKHTSSRSAPQQPHNNQQHTHVYTPPAPSAAGIKASQPASAYYPSPFQKHIDQLGKLLPMLFSIELCSS